jgi:hypothetical protein
MEIRVALQYPNGRVHETVYDTTRPIALGEKFEMYGHTWRAIGLAEKPRANTPPARPQRVLCVATDARR